MDKPRILTPNGVAVTIPELKGVTTKEVAGMKLPEVKTGLQKLTVVMPTVQQIRGQTWYFEAGNKVWVSSQALMSFPWAKETFEIDGVFFIIVPAEYISAFHV